MLYKHPAYEMASGEFTPEFEIQLLAKAGMTATSGLTNPSPIVAFAFFDEFRKLELGRSLKAFLGTLAEKLFQTNLEPATDHPIPAVTPYGINLPLAVEDSKALQEEVRRYKWLEAERAGRDIWRERDPQDPEGVAFREWFSHHFGAWYLSRVRGHSFRQHA